MLSGGIYRIENILTGFNYVGQSINLHRRKNDHFSELKRGKHDNGHLQNSFNKYGEDNFIFVIVLYCDLEHLTYFEQIINDYYKNKNQSYNIRKIVDSNKNIDVSDEFRIKMREINLGKIISPETRMKISIANSGKEITEEQRLRKSESHKGNLLSDETKKKISQSNTGKIVSDETKNKISVSNMGKKRNNSSSKYIGVSYNKVKKQMDSIYYISRAKNVSWCLH